MSTECVNNLADLINKSDNTEYQISVMKAYMDGKVIERRIKNGCMATESEWSEVTIFDWNWETYDYRVREDKEVDIRKELNEIKRSIVKLTEQVRNIESGKVTYIPYWPNTPNSPYDPFNPTTPITFCNGTGQHTPVTTI